MSPLSDSKDVDRSANIDLRILSPSTEVDRELFFQCLPVATTIAQLKERIQKSISSSPEADRQRLIFRGRVIMRDDVTLVDVFGKDTVSKPNRLMCSCEFNIAKINQSQSQSLHLVLRELRSHSNQLSEDTHHQRPNRVLASSHQPYTSTPYSEYQRYSSEPSGSSFGTQAVPKSSLTKNNNGAERVHSQLSTIDMNNGQLATLQGQDADRALDENAGDLPRQLTATALSNAQPSGSDTMSSHNNKHDDKEHNTSVIGRNVHNEPCSSLPPQNNKPPFPRTAHQSKQHSSYVQTETSIDFRSLSSKLEALQLELTSIKAILRAAHDENPQFTFIYNLQNKHRGLEQMAQDIANELFKASHHQSFHPSQLAPSDNALIKDFLHQLRHQRESTNNFNRAADSTLTDAAKTQDSSSTQAAFLVQNRNGPYAVVYRENNAYVSTQRNQPLPRIDPNLLYRSRIGPLIPAQSTLPANNGARTVPVNAAQPIQNQNQHRNQNQNAGNNAREEQNAEQGLQNIAGRLWLLVQTIGFIFLFGGSIGWRRQLMFVALSILFYAARLGLFGDRWARLRQHLEGLLPTEEGIGRNRRRERRPRTGNRRGSTRSSGREEVTSQGSTSNRPTPTPEDRARLLVRQRQEWLWDTITDQLRSLERVLALFVATLWPGVGERHIAARRDAEAEVETNGENASGREAEAAVQDEQRSQLDNASAENPSLPEPEGSVSSPQAATRTENVTGES